MNTTHTFPSDSGQAVLLPPDIAYDDISLELNIVREGDIIMIYPAQAVAPRSTVALLPFQPGVETSPVTEPSETPEHAWD
jgi:virulence-associated protein VagC